MRPGPAREERRERTGRRREERRRHTDRRGHTHAVSVAGHILDRDPALVAGDPHDDRAARGGELLEPRVGCRPSAAGARRDLVRAKVAEATEQVVNRVGRARQPLVGQRLELELEVGQGVRVEQLTQLLLAEQLAQQVAVERERAGTSPGQRCVPVVASINCAETRTRSPPRRRLPSRT